MRQIGRTKPKLDAHAKVTGAANFPADILRENSLYGCVMFSGQPHARMISMDLSQALAVEGVLLILTAADVPKNEYGLTLYDQPVLVGLNSTPHAQVSRWEADQVAFIVAESKESAEIAREKIQIEWEPLPVISDVFDALKDETILQGETNAYYDYKIRKGDMEAGWAAADIVIDARYRVPMQEHAYLQPEAGTSYIDDDGRITVEVAGQWTHEDQAQVAHALMLDPDQIRIIYPAIGGAFGGREDMSIQIVLALAAQKLAGMGIYRPIHTIWTREESIIGHHKRHQAVIDTKWGATKDGKIVAVAADCYLDAGAYNYTSNKVLGNLHLCVAGPYDIPNARIDSRAIYTNNVPGGAFRGFGAPQGCFAAESQMNKLAAALGIDPVELRLKNVLRDGIEGLTGVVLPAGVSIGEVVAACGQQAAASSQQPTVTKSAFASLQGDETILRRGKGFACAYKNVGFSFGFPERCEATIVLHGAREISGVTLYHAGADVGQGAHTAFRQMAAEAVGVPVELVEIVASDTATSGDSGSASASRLTWMAGNAIIRAADQALREWRDEERPARGHVRYTPPPTQMLDKKTGEGQPNFAYGYVAESAEITIDIETGHIWVDRVVCADDVGKAINSNLIEGQIEGAVVQAHGYTLTENLQVADGFIKNPRFSSYLIPGIQDVPARVESVILEIPDPRGPFGVRGMAEMPLIPLAPAITAALHDATGVWFDEIPLTPSRVVAKLREHGIC